jgi:hypothetical protein
MIELSGKEGSMLKEKWRPSHGKKSRSSAPLVDLSHIFAGSMHSDIFKTRFNKSLQTPPEGARERCWVVLGVILRGCRQAIVSGESGFWGKRIGRKPVSALATAATPTTTAIGATATASSLSCG